MGFRILNNRVEGQQIAIPNCLLWKRNVCY